MSTLPPLSDEQLELVLREVESPHVACCAAREPQDWIAENAPLYRGRGSAEVERLRGFVMARLALQGRADALYPRAVEDLATAAEPYLLAAAARVVRAAGEASSALPSLLLSAIERVQDVDEFVSFESYPPQPGTSAVTAVDELVETLAGLGTIGTGAVKQLGDDVAQGRYVSPRSRALLQAALAPATRAASHAGHACCSAGTAGTAPPLPGIAEPPTRDSHEAAPHELAVGALVDVVLENQDGQAGTFGQIFGERVAVVAFFYTRCMNPEKCSRTIGQLALLRSLLDAEPLGQDAMVAAITYDPAFDNPSRLRRYGEDRKLPFGERCQLLRTLSPFETVAKELDLGVGFGPATVNRHRVELFLVDPRGSIRRFAHCGLWTADDVLKQVRPSLSLLVAADAGPSDGEATESHAC